MKVRLTKATRYRGENLKVDTLLDVDAETLTRWERAGIAKGVVGAEAPAKAKVPRTEKTKE